MALTFRPTQPRDFPQCLGVMHEGFLFPTPASRAELSGFWRKALADGTALSTVVEEEGRPEGRKIVGFCMYIFVTDDFAGKILADLHACLSPQVLKGWKKGGSQNPILSRKAAAQHNAGDGLNLTVLHYGVEPRKSFELEVPVRAKIFESYQAFHMGYQVKRYLHEVYGAAEKKLMEQVGCRVLKENAGATDAARKGEDRRPYLTGLDRGEALSKPGLPNPVFNYSPPRFGFTPGEKDVLEKVFLGGIDRDVAAELGLTVWAVKKRWQGIYEKVEKVDPSILGPVGIKNDEEYQKTRRRFLLDYLRAHQEELRPYAPVRAVPQKRKKWP